MRGVGGEGESWSALGKGEAISQLGERILGYLWGRQAEEGAGCQVKLGVELSATTDACVATI